ncbi:MAG: filamentous hemagglutinin N-terminal domain-containing protein [Sporomusaceae bacterium]|nr:filamentous hemagglutinin N-terminal domain-containing protein [Sporomusaceae bacterium]
MQRKWRRNWQRAIAKTVLPPVAAGMLMLGAYGPAWAAPSGGVVTGGTATIATSGATTTVTQTTNRAAINWQSFGIAAGEAVNFVQPSASAVALNRVVGNSASNIYGSLTANGKVYLINPSGILFAPGAQVNVGGLVASTLNMADSDFMNGKYIFTKNGSAGAVINQGTITAGDHAVFIGPQVKNEGTVAARVVGLTAGDKVSLDFSGDKLLNVTVDTAAAGSSVTNSGTITAPGGLVLMTTGTMDALLNTVVNNTGVIRAQTVSTERGVIKLIGSTANVSGTLDASAPQGGDGGFIETSGASVNIAPDTKITTAAPAGKTGKWLLDPTDLTVDFAMATAIMNNLANTDSELNSTGSINVNAPITWSANELAFIATKDININAVLTANGTAWLYLGAGSGKVNMGRNADGTFKGRVDFPGRSGSGFFMINLKNYTVINSLGAAGSTTTTDLQGINGNVAGYYALGADIDASETSGWNGGAGFVPLGDPYTASAFTGIFEGLGHTIGNLTVKPATASVGLFGTHQGTIRNVGLKDVTAAGAGTSYVGGLAAYSTGSIANTYVTGTVSGGTNAQVGGLVGINNGSIANSYNTAAVTGGSNANVGGLVGDNSGTITGSASTAGTVSGSSSGYTGSYGGLVGVNRGTVTGSYSTSPVNWTLGNSVGGLAGWNDGGTITNSYSTGTVSGSSAWVGGLVGVNNGTIVNSYSAGSVSGSGSYAVGGLVGVVSGGTVTGGYWDIQTSGLGTSAAGTGLTTANMRQASQYAGWGFDANGISADGVWRIYSGHSNPLLRSFLTPLTVTSFNGGKTYDGTTATSLGVFYSATPNNYLAGTAVVTAVSKNAGAQSARASGLYSTDQRGYDITYAAGILVINQRDITVTASGVNKIYDGTTGAAVNYGDNRVSGDSLAVSGTATFADKNAGTGKAVSVTGITLSGADAGNYNLTGTTASTTADIAKATLTVTADNAAKTQGQTNPAFTASYSGLGAGDTAASLTGGLTFATGATATSPAGSYAINLTGTLASPNYIVSYVNGVLTVRAATNPAYTGAVGGAFQLAGGGGLGGIGSGTGGTGLGGGLGGGSLGGTGFGGGGFAGGMGGSLGSGTGGLGGTTALGGLLGISGGGINTGGAGPGGRGQNQ